MERYNEMQGPGYSSILQRDRVYLYLKYLWNEK